MQPESISVAGWRGHVRQESSTRGLIWEGHNLIVTLAPEVMMAALMGSTYIDKAAFGYGAGRPVTPSIRSIPSVVMLVPSAQKTIGRDRNNRRTLGTWRFLWNPDQAQTYDTLGLLASTGQLFAATTFPKVELTAGEAVAVAWTIYLRD